DERIQSSQLMNLWQGHIEKMTAINLLESLGFQQASRCYELVSTFHHSPRCRRLSQAARLRLDRFMVLLLSALMQVKEPEIVLLNMIHLLENIVGRSAYLALLTENPHVLKQLIHWFAHCPFITTLIINYPFLLEILLKEDERWQPSSRKILQQQLQEQLAHCFDEGLQEEMLRQFKLTQWLMTARAEINGDIDAVAAGRFLADVAQVLVKAVVTLACQQLADRYPEIGEIASQFAIIAYGKLGSQEMNYKSDLDLVFVHSSSHEEEGLVIRLTQKIMHMLTTRLQFGILYQVDTRLRPSGEGGLLVSRLQAFIQYQKNQAWTWEHQALIRSRVIVGSAATQRALILLKKDVFLIARSREKIAQEIQEMRQKMRQHNQEMTIKLAPGGLVDLEFLVQFLILVNPGFHYHRYTHTLQILHQLAKAQVITPEELQTLEQIYRCYHGILHDYVLEPDKVTDWGGEQKRLVALLLVFYSATSC
ncbi:MAG: bifunctional [glutamate--ammonia ligase]-adenylyl-L-tyrosine phosphorylase/[glutamate--ammonia-ligase] adenylyltransferase, partial [Cyanobacteria bacterium]|nr:bifunctional [glutamate--ammonia ligase]-adenylyl-L-tyrosine phosphorylase/[glutamate--ammonia-ligase] adenylyltransferase [Cyanobacteriota bacterium]